MEKPTLLIIDDEEHLLTLYAYQVKSLGYDVVTGKSGADFRRLIEEREYAAALLDVMLPDTNGVELMEEAHRIYPDLPVILITAYGTIEKAVDAMKRGAMDFLEKGRSDFDYFAAVVRNAVSQYQLRREVRSLRRQVEPPEEFQGMVGQSPRMIEIYETIERVAPTSTTVMITGESGTGKELVARAVHNLSGRNRKPFVAINCAALPRDLLESELFGHERGSFTGAVDRHLGCFERADGGTLFLDEICEMDLGLQVKLLRVIQERIFYRVGGSKPIQVDVRLLSATNQNPREAIDAGRFREDLFYRMNVVPINLPPLRERLEDIGQIAGKVLHEFSAQNGRAFQGFDLSALSVMERYRWGGNVRELRNVVEQIVVLNDGERVTLEMLPEAIRRAAAEAPPPIHLPLVEAGHAAVDAAPDPGVEYVRPFWQVERDSIQRALDLCSGNVQDVARRLELSPATLYRKIEKYGLVK